MRKLLLLLLMLPGFIKAQVSVKDSVIRCTMISFNGAGELPGGNLAKRFGPNAATGLSCFYKTRKNCLYAFNWSYMFGDQLKEDSPLNSISTADGLVIDQEGTYAQVRLFERGMRFSLSAGKVFHVLAPNPNCGFFATGGLGYFYHKIRLDDVGNRAPQLRGDYKKGYDRLTGGMAVNEFVGYWFMSKNRFVNFYGGFEFTQAMTHSLRSWDFDRMAADTAWRTDVLYGFRVGWVVPFYKRASKDYYFN